MALAKRVSNREFESEVFDFYTKEDIKKNITFLMLVNSLITKEEEEPKHNIIQVIDPQDENNVLCYTNDKFLEVIDLYGLDGFIY